MDTFEKNAAPPMTPISYKALNAMNAIHQRLLNDHNELLGKTQNLDTVNQQSVNLSQFDDKSVSSNSETTIANVKITNKRTLLVDGDEHVIEKKIKTEQGGIGNNAPSVEENNQAEDHQAEQEVMAIPPVNVEKKKIIC